MLPSKLCIWLIWKILGWIWKENKFDIIIISGGQMANAFVYEMHKIIQVIDVGSIEFGTNIYLEAKKDLLN